MSISEYLTRKVLSEELSPWTNNLEKQFENYPFNEHLNEHQFETTELINLSPELLKDIENARESLKYVTLYEDKDIFGV